jgi:hypothetical protein
MAAIATKLKTSTAAVALTAAAVLTPAALARADEDITAASARAIGNSAFLEVAYLDDSAGASETPYNAPLQNKWIWIGQSNPEPPAPYAILFHLDPMVLVSQLPEPVRELYGWFTKEIHFETCVLGASLKFGPYGTVTSALARTC